jgi:hypothetical protein
VADPTRRTRPSGRRSVILVAASIPALLLLYGSLIYFTLPARIGQESTLRAFFAAAATGLPSAAATR